MIQIIKLIFYKIKMLFRRDDGYLYHSDGMFYMDGDEVDDKGLFLPNGKPADLKDFKQRYYTEPPQNWAKKFADYSEYTLEPIEVKDNEQIEAEEQIRRGELVRRKEYEVELDALKPYFSKDQAKILRSIQVYIEGIPSLNGYASYTETKDRYIVLHAGIKLILSRLGTFISNTVWRRTRMVDMDTLKFSLISLAKFVGSGGLDGRLIGAWKPQSVNHAEEIANAFIDGIQSIPIRESQTKWILAHECAHHIFNHLEIIEDDLRRCNNVKDIEHYRLRQKLEFEADLKAFELILKMEKIGLTRQATIDVIDHYLSFMCFVDFILKSVYSDTSTHPSSMKRLMAYREYIKKIGEGFSSHTNTWSNLLNGILHEFRNTE